VSVPLKLGPCIGTIYSHKLREVAGKTVVDFDVETDYGAQCDVLVWITQKSLGIARAQLKVAGFDIDEHELSLIDESPAHCAGKKIPLVVESYNGKLRAQIDVHGAKPDKDSLSQLTLALRSAKKASAAAAPDEPPPLGDEDIPF
jgi:hypothetical protein